MGDIKIDFACVELQAKQLEEIAEGIARLAKQNMADAVERMAAAWAGESASAYLAKAGLVQQELLKTADSLFDAACSVRAQAGKLYEAERAAIEQFKSRSK